MAKKNRKSQRLNCRISDDLKKRLEELTKQLGKRSIIDTISLLYWIAQNHHEEFIFCPHCQTINFAKMELPRNETFKVRCSLCEKDYIYNDETEKTTIIT